MTSFPSIDTELLKNMVRVMTLFKPIEAKVEAIGPFG